MGIKYKVDSTFFKAWSASMSYVLGFITADGSLEDAPYLRGKYLRIYSSDVDIVEKIKSALGSEHKIVSIAPQEVCIEGKRYNSRERYMLRIGSQEIYNDLLALGVTPHKSKTIQFPVVPRDFIPAFLRGYLDGDGCISIYGKKKRLSVTFTSGSKLFLEGLSKTVSCALGLKTHKVFQNHRAFQIKYSTKEAVIILKYIYLDISNGLFLDRKHKIFLAFCGQYPEWREYVGVVPKWLRELSAKQLFTGSSPVHALN